MVDAERFLAFLVAASVLAAIPGPGMLYVVAHTLGGGRRAGLSSTAGTAIGGSAHVVAATVGLSALLATSAFAFTVVKYAGAAYLVFLGVRMLLRARREGVSPGLAGELEGESDGSGSGLAALRQGALVEALNPKTALFFLAFIPQFVDPLAGPAMWQFAVLGTVVVVLNTLADVVAVGLSGMAHRRFAVRGHTPRWPKLVSGSALIGLGGYAALES